MGGALAYRAVARSRRRIDFDGRGVLITGGSRGLGLALARELAAQGANVAIVARDGEELERARASLGGVQAEIIVTDLTLPDAAIEVVGEAIARLGRLDVLINNAGVIMMGPIEHNDQRDFEEAMAIHFWAPLSASLAAVPHLQRTGGRIINIGSFGGKVAVPHLAPYCASKFALVGISDGLRAELRSRGIRVTTVCPGLIRTGSHVNALFKGANEAEYAWFATSAALPGASWSTERAARAIVEAGRYGDASLILGIPARLLILAAAIAPGLTAELMALVARLMPRPRPEAGTERHTGWDSREQSIARLTRRVDREIEPNNEQRPARRAYPVH